MYNELYMVINDEKINLKYNEVFMFSNAELSDNALEIIEMLENESGIYYSQFKKLPWVLRSITEFEDIINNNAHYLREDNIFAQNYCFYECIYALRESVLTGFNATYHASFATMRSTLELALLHSYWVHKFKEEKEKDFFYWINTGKGKPGFNELKKYFLKNYTQCDIWDLKKDIETIYTKLCSYSHTPILSESIAKISGTNNKETVNFNSIIYWLKIMESFSITVLKILITIYPMSVYPVNIIKKFGLNRIDGIFFDRFNYLPLSVVFNDKELDKLKTVFSQTDDVISYMNFYNNLDDLSISDIRKTINDSSIHKDQINKLKCITSTDDEDWIVGWACVKTFMRLSKEVYCYNDIIRVNGNSIS